MGNKRARKAAAARKRAAAAAAASAGGGTVLVLMECCAPAAAVGARADEATLSTLPSAAAALRAALHGGSAPSGTPVGACDAAGRRMAAFGTAPGLSRLSAEELRLACDIAYRQCRDTLLSPSAREHEHDTNVEPFTYARHPRLVTPARAAIQFAATCRLPVLGSAPSVDDATAAAADHPETFAFAVPARNEPDDIFFFHVVAPADGWSTFWDEDERNTHTGTNSCDCDDDDEGSIDSLEQATRALNRQVEDADDDEDGFRRFREFPLQLPLPGEVDACDMEEVHNVLQSTMMIPPRSSNQSQFKQHDEHDADAELQSQSVPPNREAPFKRDKDGLQDRGNDRELERSSSGASSGASSNKEDECATPTGSSLWSSFGRLFSFGRSPSDNCVGAGAGSTTASSTPVPVPVPLPTAVSDTGPLATSPTTPHNCASEEDRASARSSGTGTGSRRVLRAARTLKQPPSSPRDHVADPTVVATLTELRSGTAASAPAPERARRKKMPKVKRRPRVRLVPEDEDQNTAL